MGAQQAAPLWILAGVILPVSSPPIHNGYILIENGVITQMGEGPAPDGDFTTLDWRDSIVTPGLINAHCHLELTSLGTLHLPRSDSFFVDWIKHLLPAKQEQSANDLNHSIKDGIKRLMASGVTHIADHVSPTTPLDLFLDSPLSLSLFGEVLGINREGSIAALNAFANAAIPITPSPHSAYSIHPDMLRKLLTESKQPLSIHLDESQEEHLLFSESSGALYEFLNKIGSLSHLTKSSSALRYLKNQNLPLKNIIAIHANCVGPEDISLLKECRGVVHCPGSHAYFEHADFKLESIRDNGILVALGTDSLASNPDLNMLAEMKLMHEAHPNIPKDEILKMATMNAAKILGLSNKGELKSGACADIASFKITQDDPMDTLLTASKANALLVSGSLLI